MAFGIAPIAAATPDYPVARVDASRISQQDRAERRGEVNAQQAAIQSQREPAPATTQRQTIADNALVRDPQPQPQPLDFSDQPRPSPIETDAAVRAYAESQEADEAQEAASERLQSQRAVASYQDSPTAPQYLVDLSR
jgi:hypothetical protein